MEKKKAVAVKEKSLANIIFSWSLEDIYNGDLYKDQVEEIPNLFESVEHYLTSFVYPLLEETRSDMCTKMGSISSAPFGKVISLKKQSTNLYYDILVDQWKQSLYNVDKDRYRAKFGDILAFTDNTPGLYLDMQGLERNWSLGFVTRVTGNDDMYIQFEVRTSKELVVEQDVLKKSFYAVFVTNVTTNHRIWKTMTSFKNVDFIKEILDANSVVQERCKLCPSEVNEMLEKKLSIPSKMNKSQREAVVESIFTTNCDHKSSLKLIWGPPGTGKTSTLSVMLLSMLRLKYRTLICCPTNAAISEIASRVMKEVKDDGSALCSLGDILVYGNIDQTSYFIDEMCLNYRVQRLSECLTEGTGWKRCITNMIDLLENGVSLYINLCEENVKDDRSDVNDGGPFLQFIRTRFSANASTLRKCISNICTHFPKTFILKHNYDLMVSMMNFLNSFETFLLETNLDGEELKEAFLVQGQKDINVNISRFLHVKSECLQILRNIQHALEHLKLPRCNKDSVEEFCFRMASMIFCTASSSYKLHSVRMCPMKLLVVDEAAQLRECELLIPLQVPSIKHVVLLGDECQLPAFVSSKVSAEAGLGKSLFERLTLLGFSRHLLDTQYRMHPTISRFPNTRFYQNRIIDADIVKSENYLQSYIPGRMFGSYAFMNISCSREDHSDGHSWKNMVEVAVLLKILQLLFKACNAARVKVTVGVISPYSAQVSEIQLKLGKKYDNYENFKVQIGSIDGFQGGEKDVIIFSTVRSNKRGSVGFTSSLQRTNVALTRARHCLWILGNEETMSSSDSVWDQLILDAKVRRCFFNADDDKDLQKVIMDVKKDLDQLGDMLNADSMLFRNARWKLMFSGNFTNSFTRLETVEKKNLVLLFLSKLASGWRPKRVDSVVSSKSSSAILKQYKIGENYILCSVDIYKEFCYMQALKVWDVLPSKDIKKMVERLDRIFQMYTDEYISRCLEKCVEGGLEVPMTWAASEDIIQFKSLSGAGMGDSSNDSDLNEIYLEDSKVRESLLLMKFYPLSCGAISNLLSGCDGESIGLPFELTDQERDVVLYNRSSFILGRSGTGKTTVLTMKLFRNDQLYHVASEGYHEVERDRSDERWKKEADDGIKDDMLRQLFVTVSPQLCYSVREQFSLLKRSVCGGDSSRRSSLIHIDNIDEVTHSSEIPDSFYDLPPNSYPLIITFHKFLMMLDGTLGISYFDRFPAVRKLNNSRAGKSRSVTLETFLRTREVTFERFNSLYWPHFNRKFIRKLGSLTVFTEIMSVIKGGLQENGDVGPVGEHEYISLSQKRSSTMSTEKREHVYKIFIDYEKRKVESGDFDQADLVIDLHRRLKDKRYKGDLMDFVFIDEVQDLSMRQILLFKYICTNVEEGFAFAGDTAQTIAKGINFRFEDIRYLFYKEFLGDKNVSGKRNEKGQISSLFHLSHNFRTHVGVLKLAHSVINIICHFFPSSIDFLNPETSLISGEAPVLLETGSTDALTRIFVNTEVVKGNVIAFGAEQVILVRDDYLKKEICDSVGKKALVLTILECKGLEFQDVLLYNFFSSSPFEHEWRLIYNYMNANNHLDSTSSSSFPKFDLEKHGILCSELKQLYVAVTRAKQRLWICENSNEYSQPMFDYWKKLSVACERILDETFIKEMQVESNEEDWKSRGMKLFHENNYEMAMMCFERAGDSYWVKMSEASLYQASAHMRQPNSEIARTCLKKAAEIFDAIGKAESAARLFVQIDEYERAGFIYLNNLKRPDLEKSGECFCLAKCFRQAAKVYASGGLYSKCLSACLYGKLFEMGLKYMQEWKQSGVLANCADEIDQSFRELLQNGAVHYYEQNDYKNMMKFVESFQSKDSMRNFLENFNLLRQLLDLEIRWGNFLQAAQIAKQLGDCLLEADLLSKCGVFQEASLLMLWYVFSHLTTSRRGNYVPSYNFKKDDILQKAIANAKNHSNAFYEFACMEVAILSEAKSVESILESGLQFVRYWRQHVVDGLVKTSFELDEIEQDLLERCAHRYYDLNDCKTMMKFVNDFQSVDLMRAFLKTVNCLDELILLEENEGNFFEAARIAKQIGDCLLEADLLSKYGAFQEASLLMLWYVFSNLTTLRKGNYGPSIHFKKDEILQKAIATAKNHSPSFYEFACTEADILSEAEAVVDILESGLHFVRNWRENVADGLVRTSFELDNVEHDLLKRCARHYYDLNDYEAMMKFVDDFRSVDLKRSFLKTVNCLDELILLEEREGNFLEAAKIAELKGDVLWKSDLLLKYGDIRESCFLIHWYVFAESSWAHGNGGWPLRSFTQKEDLLDKAKGSAENHSDDLYLFVCSESNILSNQELSLSEMGQYLYNSTVHRSLRSEILASRRLLDSHMNTLPSSYKWNDEFVFISTKNVEDKFSQNQVSVATLVFVWNYWKDIILELIQFVSSKPGQNVQKYSNLEDYILNYFGVRKNYHNREIIYAVLNPGAKWVNGTSLLRRTSYPACISLQNFFTVALNHLCSELFSVGIEVLVELKLLYTHCRITSLSVFCQSKCLFYIFEVAKFLRNYKFPNRKYIDNRTAPTYLKLSSGEFYENVFHVDCQRSLSKEMIMLREASVDILKEAIFGSNYEKNVPTTIEHMGRLTTMILGCGKHTYLNDNNIKSFCGNQIWMDLIEGFNYTQRSNFGSDTSPGDLDDMWNEVSLTYSIYAVLKYCIGADWRPQHGHISPSCFLYLAERLMVMVARFQGHFFVTKSACVEWLIYEGWNVRSSHMEMPLVMVDVYNLIAFQIETLLLNKNDTLQWFKNSYKNSEYYSLMVLRLIVLLCLICMNSGLHFDKLFSLLDRDDIMSELPGEFCSALMNGNRYFVEALSDALSRIKNPLVIVSLVENFAESKFSCSNVILLNKKKLSCGDLLTELFPETPLESSTTLGHNEGEDLVKMCGLFWEIFDGLVYLAKESASSMQFMSTAIVIKVEVEKFSNLLVFSLETSQCEDDGDLTMQANIMVEELNQLSNALDMRNICDENIKRVVKISKGLQLRRLKMEPFLDNLFMQIHQHNTQTDARRSFSLWTHFKMYVPYLYCLVYKKNKQNFVL